MTKIKAAEMSAPLVTIHSEYEIATDEKKQQVLETLSQFVYTEKQKLRLKNEEKYSWEGIIRELNHSLFSEKEIVPFPTYNEFKEIKFGYINKVMKTEEGRFFYSIICELDKIDSDENFEETFRSEQEIINAKAQVKKDK